MLESFSSHHPHPNPHLAQSHELGDRMESFFLAETLKYLYLLVDDNNFIHKGEYIFSTEVCCFCISLFCPLQTNSLSLSPHFMQGHPFPLSVGRQAMAASDAVREYILAATEAAQGLNESASSLRRQTLRASCPRPAFGARVGRFGLGGFDAEPIRPPRLDRLPPLPPPPPPLERLVGLNHHQWKVGGGCVR